jgi:hypothetical protein
VEYDTDRQIVINAWLKMIDYFVALQVIIS